MSLKVKEFCKIIEKYAPLQLKENYDNVGLMVGDTEQEINSILVSLDCTYDVIHEAEKKNCELIFTHHPLLFNKPSSITNHTSLGKKIMMLVKNNISLYSSHTNLDSVQDGLNDRVMHLIGFNSYEIIEPNRNSNNYSIKSGIGRTAYIPDGIKLSELCSKIKTNLNIDNLRYAGDDNKLVHKIAVINGSGEDYFDICRENGVECVITGDTKYHNVLDMVEDGICIIDAGHFGTEWCALKDFTIALNNIFSDNKIDCKVIISENSIDIYKYK